MHDTYLPMLGLFRPRKQRGQSQRSEVLQVKEQVSLDTRHVGMHPLQFASSKEYLKIVVASGSKKLGESCGSRKWCTLDYVKKKIQHVEWPFKHVDAFARLRIVPLRGVLLYGPPGCCKTTLAKAAAHASQASFFSLK
ncbi:hypothetical protein KSP40_PGU000960 [Platanthera guangdongensis]|uniref:ATPase AAA-type core domain-containing protein n=1 Tax=Platanthera guangdongensis TaxID=2320717 RepID=A0ABR2M2R3_9ASPA